MTRNRIFTAGLAVLFLFFTEAGVVNARTDAERATLRLFALAYSGIVSAQEVEKLMARGADINAYGCIDWKKETYLLKEECQANRIGITTPFWNYINWGTKYVDPNGTRPGETRAAMETRRAPETVAATVGLFAQHGADFSLPPYSILPSGQMIQKASNYSPVLALGEYNAHMPVVKALLESGYRLTSDDATVVFFSLTYSGIVSADELDELIAAGANINGYGCQDWQKGDGRPGFLLKADCLKYRTQNPVATPFWNYINWGVSFGNGGPRQGESWAAMEKRRASETVAETVRLFAKRGADFSLPPYSVSLSAGMAPRARYYSPFVALGLYMSDLPTVKALIETGYKLTGDDLNLLSGDPKGSVLAPIFALASPAALKRYAEIRAMAPAAQ